MIPSSPGLPPRVELSEFARLGDPYPLYRQLRESARMCRAGGNQWLVTRYEDVVQNLRNPALKQFQIAGILRQFPASAAAQAVGEDPATQFTERILAGRDGTEHKALRAHMARALKTSFAELETIVSQELDAIAATLREQGEFDAVADLAYQLPIRTLGRIVDIPVELQAEVAEQSLRLAHVFSPQFLDSERAPVNAAVERLREIMREILQRPGPPTGDDGQPSFARRFHQQASPHFPLADIVDNVILLVFAGFETSLNLLSNGIAALLDHPDQFRRLQDDPSLVTTAIEEFLRFDSPVHLTGRLTEEPAIIAGQRVGSGRVVYLALASANRDPSVFQDPDRLDIGRRENPHVAFGAGPHVCLGAQIARCEARQLFLRLARDFGGMQASGPASRNVAATFRTLKHLPVHLSS